MYDNETGQLLPAGSTSLNKTLTTTASQGMTKIITDDELAIIQQMASGLNILKQDLDSAAEKAASLLEMDYNLEMKEHYDAFVKNFGKGCPLSKAITGIDSKRKELNKFSTSLINTRIGEVLEDKTLLLQKGAGIRRGFDEKVEAEKAAIRAAEANRVAKIDVELEGISAITDRLLRLPGQMIGKNSQEISASIDEAEKNLEIQSEEFFDEFWPAAQARINIALTEQERCLSSLRSLLSTSEAAEAAELQRAEAMRIETQRKAASEAAEAERRAAQEKELEESKRITLILTSSMRLANATPAEIKQHIALLNAEQGSQGLLDAVQQAVASLTASLVTAQKREAEEAEKKAAEEAARAAAHKKAAEEAEERRLAVEAARKKAAEEAEEARKAEELARQDTDLAKTMDALSSIGMDDTMISVLLTAVLDGNIPHLCWSNEVRA